MDHEKIIIPAALVECLRAAKSVAVLTGAGISAESGLPTFRDAMTGLWANFRPEDLATAGAFERDPALVWKWYAWRRDTAANAAPNPGHYALTEIEKRVPEFTLLTQNVDGLHQLAGSRDVVELHGSIMRSRCFREGTVVADRDAVPGDPPKCPVCGGPLRPDVVWFGENLPADALELAAVASQVCDLFISIGTSGMVEPAASLLRLAAEAGAHTAVINVERIANAAPGTVQVIGPSGLVLPALVAAAWPC